MKRLSVRFPSVLRSWIDGSEVARITLSLPSMENFQKLEKCRVVHLRTYENDAIMHHCPM